MNKYGILYKPSNEASIVHWIYCISDQFPGISGQSRILAFPWYDAIWKIEKCDYLGMGIFAQFNMRQVAKYLHCQRTIGHYSQITILTEFNQFLLVDMWRNFKLEIKKNIILFSVLRIISKYLCSAVPDYKRV